MNTTSMTKSTSFTTIFSGRGYICWHDISMQQSVVLVIIFFIYMGVGLDTGYAIALACFNMQEWVKI